MGQGNLKYSIVSGIFGHWTSFSFADKDFSKIKTTSKIADSRGLYDCRYSEEYREGNSKDYSARKPGEGKCKQVIAKV